MRVAVSGSHGIGKTTLVRNLGIRFPNADIVTEQIRSIAYRHPKIDISCPQYVKDSFQVDGFITQILEESRHKNFISDRSILDYAAYCQFLKCSSGISIALEQYAIEHCKKYDMIIHLPIPEEMIVSDKCPEEDGFRFTSKESLIMCDSLIARLARDASRVTNVVYLTKSRDTWYDTAVEHIRGVYFD